MKFTNPCLTHVGAFTEGGTNKVYLYLEYQYTDRDGNVHQYILPKVEIPIPTKQIPIIKYVEEVPFTFGQKIKEKMIIPIIEQYLPLHPGDVDIELETGQIVRHQTPYYDRIIKWNDDRKEMTQEEIEQKLGYKVKIITDKEESNGFYCNY